MSLIDIENYEGLYKFNKDLIQVYNVKTKKYLKNVLYGNHYYIYLYKNGKQKTFSLNYLINKYNNQDNNQEDFVDIDNYENYKFNLKTNEVINKNTGKYLKKNICNGYYVVQLYKNKKMKRFLLHRLVFKSHNPLINIKELFIDHINQDKLNNNINNLRLATRSQNQYNSKVYKNNILGIKNIFKTKSNTFTVNIVKDKKKHSKNFKTLEDAIIHRDLKLAEMHGEFACYI